MSAVDFSEQHPTPAQLVAAGVKAAVVKLNATNRPTTQLVQSYCAAGIVTAFYFEAEANDAAGGAPMGQLHAIEAEELLLGILGAGWAADVPIYFAVDENVAPSMTADYFVGIRRVLPCWRIGVYSDGAVLEYLAKIALALFAWQSSSASYPGNAATSARAQLRQLAEISPVPGPDVDQILAADFGQWPRPR